MKSSVNKLQHRYLSKNLVKKPEKIYLEKPLDECWNLVKYRYKRKTCHQKSKDDIFFISQFILRFIGKLKPDTALPGVSDAFRSSFGGSRSKKSTTISVFRQNLFLGSVTQSRSVAFAWSGNWQVNCRDLFFLILAFRVLKFDDMLKLTLYKA